MELGKTMSEIEIGDKGSCSRTITEADIVWYAGLSGDFNPVHINEEYAKTTPFGSRIAHGTIALGLISRVLGMILPGPGTILLGLNHRFRAPVRIGDTVTVEAVASEKIVKKNILKLKTTFTNQHGVEVITGEAVVMPPKKWHSALHLARHLQ